MVLSPCGAGEPGATSQPAQGMMPPGVGMSAPGAPGGVAPGMMMPPGVGMSTTGAFGSAAAGMMPPGIGMPAPGAQGSLQIVTRAGPRNWADPTEHQKEVHFSQHHVIDSFCFRLAVELRLRLDFLSNLQVL